MTGEDEPAYSLARRTNPGDLAPHDVEMLRYARLLTTSPASIGPEDVDRLKTRGFDDRAVLDICQVVSYYNYVNRLADGLGVELEDFWTAEEMIISREEFEVGRV